MKILKQDCKKDDAQDKTLPYTCFLIVYEVDGNEKYDLAMGSKQSEIFDYYYAVSYTHLTLPTTPYV